MIRSAFDLKLLLLVAFLLLGLATRSCSSLQLDADGGYHVQISIKSETLDSGRSEEFIDRLQGDITELARLTFETTNQQFYFKTVSLLIPESWSHSNSQIDISTSQSHTTSNIKMSDDILIPDVIRPTQCFLPGDEIKLPTSFLLEDSNVKGKTLLRLWAEYRWGVFDESGFPGNSRFPYLYKNYETAAWEVNSCFNDEVAGSYAIPDSGDLCVVDSISVTPDESCRFVPSETGNDQITSSLMNSFYEMSSIDSFCTKETHKIEHQTRHNVFCEYRSVSEVVAESFDWKSVQEPVDAFPMPVFSLVKAPTTPLVYYLFDSRIVSIPFAFVLTIRENLSKLFTSPTTDDVMSALAQFPGSGNQKLEETIPWTLIKDARTEFQERLAATISNGSTPGTGDFLSALKSIALSIKLRNHDAGAYIFVFKGSPASDYSESPFEEELILIMKETKIKLYAVEVKNSGFDIGTNLVKLVTESNGGHLVLSDSESINNLLPSFISNFVSETLSPVVESTSSQTILMELISNEETFTLKLPTGLSGPLTISLTAANLKSDSTLLINGESVGFPIEEYEYDERSSKGKRRTLIGTYDSPAVDDVIAITLICEASDCQALLAITEGEETTLVDETITVSVSTSAISNSFNGLEHPLGLSVFAKLEKGGQRAFNYQVVEASAFLCLQDNPLQCWKVTLHDNGGGAPDLMEGDGLISGTFIPSVISKYYVRVSVSFILEDISTNSMNQTNTSVKAFYSPTLPCYLVGDGRRKCVGATASRSFMKVINYPNLVEVTALNNAPAEPTRVMNFMLNEVVGHTIELMWTAPGIFTPDGPVGAEAYEIIDCESASQVIGDISSCTLTAVTDRVPGNPEQLESLHITLPDDDKLHFISLRSKYQGTYSARSNFIAIQTYDLPATEPTTTVSDRTSDTDATEPPTTTPETEVTDPATTTSETEVTDPATTSETEVTDPATPTSETEVTDPATTSETEVTDPATPTSETEVTDPATTTSETEVTDPATTESDGTSEPEYSTTNETPESTSTNPSTASSSDSSTPDLSPSTEPSTTPSSRPPTTATSRPPTTTITPVTTEDSVYFFKKPEGYATIGAIVLVTVGGVGAAIGYLVWKRNMLIKAGKLN